MTHSAFEQIVTSGVFGISFPVKHERPLKSNDVPAHTPGQEAAVFATQPMADQSKQSESRVQWQWWDQQPAPRALMVAPQEGAAVLPR